MTGTPENAQSRWSHLVRLNAAAAAPSADFQSFRAFCEKHGVGPDDIPNDIFQKFGVGRIREGAKPKMVQKALREIRAELRRLVHGTDLIPPSRTPRKGRTGDRQQQFAALADLLKREFGWLETELYADVAPAAFGVTKRLLLTMIEVLGSAGFEVPSLDQLFSREAFKVLRDHSFGKSDTMLIDGVRYRFALIARRYHEAKGNPEMAERFTRLAGKTKRFVAPSTLTRVGQLNTENWREIQKDCILSLEAAANAPASQDKRLKARMSLFATLTCISGQTRKHVRGARFAKPIEECNSIDDDAALLIGGIPIQLSDRHNQAISAWRRSKLRPAAGDERWVFAGADGILPSPSTFSNDIKEFGASFGVDLTPKALRMESVRRMMELGLDDAAIQAHLGVTQSINYETQFKVLRTITSSNTFVGKVIQKAKKEDDGVD